MTATCVDGHSRVTTLSCTGTSDFRCCLRWPRRGYPRSTTSPEEDHMRSRQHLKGRNVAVLAADGFEKVELTIPMRALKRAGADLDIVSLRRGRIRGVNLHMPARRVRVNKTISEADPADYDGLLLPGG